MPLTLRRPRFGGRLEGFLVLLSTVSSGRRNPPRYVVVCTLGFVLTIAVLAGSRHPTQAAGDPVPAPGWAPLGYAAPVPGTYQLPPLGEAGDGAVLDVDRRPRRLHEFLGDKLVVLSFVYRSCPDLNGCPLANHVLSGVQRRVLADPVLRDRVRLISISFDPARDRPEDMRRLGAALAPAGADWVFLTAESEPALAPLLRAYGQAVRPEVDATISHVLRVFAIDRARKIRNIYSSAFLHADIVIGDLRTLDTEETVVAARAAPAREKVGPAGLAFPPPLGLPAVPVPADNPITAVKVALGRKLFFDRRLSRNDTISCGMCHVPEQGFTVREMATAVGIEGHTVRRNAPTIYNAAYAARLFHDGRAASLEQQVWVPLLAHNEMDGASADAVVRKIQALPDYDGLFEAAFGERGAAKETIGMALATYERTLISANSRFDRWRFGKDGGAMSAAAQRGFQLFTGQAGCVHCHTIGADDALFADQEFHNTGVGYRQAMAKPAARQLLQIAPGTSVTFDPDVVADASEPVPSDLGRYEITAQPGDRWKYKTPGLRNVALTAPYMHDGSLATLRAVVDFYNGGGVANDGLDPAIRPLGLDERARDDLVAFLKSLTGNNVTALVADALAAPIGDPD